MQILGGVLDPCNEANSYKRLMDSVVLVGTVESGDNQACRHRLTMRQARVAPVRSGALCVQEAPVDTVGETMLL